VRAVSDTSPIAKLASIGRLDVLKSQFWEIWIPTAVAQELENHPDAVAVAAIQAPLNEGWIVSTAASQSTFFEHAAASHPSRRGRSDP